MSITPQVETILDQDRSDRSGTRARLGTCARLGTRAELLASIAASDVRAG